MIKRNLGLSVIVLVIASGSAATIGHGASGKTASASASRAGHRSAAQRQGRAHHNRARSTEVSSVAAAFPDLEAAAFDDSAMAKRIMASLARQGQQVDGVHRVGLVTGGEAYVAWNTTTVFMWVVGPNGGYVVGSADAPSATDSATPLVASIDAGDATQVTALVPSDVKSAKVKRTDGSSVTAVVEEDIASATTHDPVAITVTGAGGSHTTDLGRR